MAFFNFLSGEPRYIRRIRSYLDEARMAALEHSIAAEHYKASAEMYAERARRLEEELQALEEQKGVAGSIETFAATSGAVYTGANRREAVLPSMGAAVPSSVGIVRAA